MTSYRSATSPTYPLAAEPFIGTSQGEVPCVGTTVAAEYQGTFRIGSRFAHLSATHLYLRSPHDPQWLLSGKSWTCRDLYGNAYLVIQNDYKIKDTKIDNPTFNAHLIKNIQGGPITPASYTAKNFGNESKNTTMDLEASII